VIFPQGTFTPLVHAHAGRTQGQSRRQLFRCGFASTTKLRVLAALDIRTQFPAFALKESIADRFEIKGERPMNTKRLATVLLAFLAGCAAPPPAAVSSGPAFDRAAAELLLRPGNNVISGSAFLRQQGGGVVTCAGRDVSLIPATAYAHRVFVAVYGTATEQARNHGRPVRIEPSSDEFGKLMKTTQCDAQGNFSFDGVADGEFFLETTVTWVVAGATNGGPIFRPARVSGGERIRIVISP